MIRINNDDDAMMVEVDIYLIGSINKTQMASIKKYIVHELAFEEPTHCFLTTKSFDSKRGIDDTYEHNVTHCDEEGVHVELVNIVGNNLKSRNYQYCIYNDSEYSICVEVASKRALALVLGKLVELGIDWNLCDVPVCVNGKITPELYADMED